MNVNKVDDKTAEIVKHVTFSVHLFNPIVKAFHHLGLPMGPTILLTVRGRKTGRPRTTPVGIFEHDDHRYLFATFGEVKWVRNLRAAQEAVIAHGRHKETVVAVELTPEEAAPIMKRVFTPYLNSRMRRSALRMGYDLTKDASVDDYQREAKLHPGFELHTKP